VRNQTLALVFLGRKQLSESVTLIKSVHARGDGASAVAEQVTSADHSAEALAVNLGHVATALAVARMRADVGKLDFAVVTTNHAGDFTGTVLLAPLDEATKSPSEVLAIGIWAL
jgi:autotransporter translocation and assembly factor TamB